MPSKLGIALRRKYKTPRAALQALGLPESLISVKRLAFDQRNIGPIPGTTAKMRLEEMLCTVLSGHELQRARDLLHSIDADDGEADEGELEQQEAEDGEDDEETEEQLREQRRKTMAKVADFFADRKNMSPDQIEDAMLDFPRNALRGGFGGRFSEDEREDLKKVMEDHKARRRRMAGDARRRQHAFDSRFAGAARVTGTLLETSYGSPMPERRVADDGAAERNFLKRFPQAARIG